MILLRLELPGKCSPASWAPCLPGDLGKVKPVSGDWSMKTSPKGRVWAQKSTLLCRAPGFPGSAQPANRKTFHGALRRYLRKRNVDSFKEESSALRTGQAVVCTEERSQHANKQKAVARLKAQIEQHNQNRKAEEKNDNWRCHTQLERGNAQVRFEGESFQKN